MPPLLLAQAAESGPRQLRCRRRRGSVGECSSPQTDASKQRRGIVNDQTSFPPSCDDPQRPCRLGGGRALRSDAIVVATYFYLALRGELLPVMWCVKNLRYKNPTLRNSRLVPGWCMRTPLFLSWDMLLIEKAELNVAIVFLALIVSLYVWKVWRGIFEIVSLRDGFNLRQVVRLSSVGNRIHTFTNSTLSHYQSLLLTREESQPLKCPHVTVLRMAKTLFLHGAEFGRRRAEEGWLKIRLEFESLTSCTVQVILGLRKSTLVANNARCSKHKLKRNESDVGFTLGLIDGSNYNIIDSERSGGGGGGSDASDECEVMLERRSRRKRKGDCEGLLSMGPGPETNGLNEASDTSWQKLSEPNRTRRVRSSRSDTSTTLRVLEQQKQSDYLAMSDLIKFEHRSPEPSGETGAAEDRAGDLNARKERQRSKFSCDIDMLLTTETLNGIAVLAASSDMERYSVAIVFTQLQTNGAEGLSQACPMDNSNHGQASPVNRALGIAHGNMRTRELQLRSHIVLLDIEAQERTGTAIEASLQMEHLLKSGTGAVSGAMDEGKDNGSKPEASEATS